MLPARHRLRTSSDFAAVVRGAGSVRSGSRLLVLHGRSGGTPSRPPRVGFVVSKAVGGAVTRNRTKRVLRHLVADRITGVPAGCDLVVRANAAAARATTPELAVDLDRTLAAVLRRLPDPAPAPVGAPS